MCAFVCCVEGIGREVGLVSKIFLSYSNRIWKSKAPLFECSNFQKIHIILGLIFQEIGILKIT